MSLLISFVFYPESEITGEADIPNINGKVTFNDFSYL